MSFVKVPNLPENPVKQLVLGQKYMDLLQAPLEKLGIELIPMPENPALDARLCAHADLSVLHAGGERVILAQTLLESEFSANLRALGAQIIPAHRAQSAEYPHDAILNAAAFGESIIYNPKTADETIGEILTDGRHKISVAQGYARCATCIVSESAIITADNGIARAAAATGTAVLTVKPNIARLEGYNCGFIGGSSFKIARDKLAFTGIIPNPAQRRGIEAFLNIHEVEPVYLSSKPIFDIGTAIPLTE